MISTLKAKTVECASHYGKRVEKIDTVTIHCTCGIGTVDTITRVLNGKKAGCNFIIDKDGNIAIHTPLDCGAKTSSSKKNDMRAITIETCSTAVYPYVFTPDSYSALLECVLEICDEYGFKTVEIVPRETPYKTLGDGICRLTFHRYFTSTACPGDWFLSIADVFVDTINKELIRRREMKMGKSPIEEVYTTKKFYRIFVTDITVTKVRVIYPSAFKLDDGRIQIAALSDVDNANRVIRDVIARGWRYDVEEVVM